MQKLFQFLYQYRAFLLFVILEVICWSVIVQSNKYQSAAFFNSSNEYAGAILKSSNEVEDYFSLKEANQQLANENARLNYLITIEKQKKSLVIPNKSDFLRTHQYNFLSARVINNSTSRFMNYITLDKGTEDGIRPQMGVISPNGVVGKIKNCSKHYSTVTSLLHEKMTISSKIARGNIEGMVKWDGSNPRYADLQFVGRHHKLFKGDTVVTSGYSSVFPAGIMVGIIKSFEIDQGQPFYKIRILLSTDFTALSYVYVIENKFKSEKDSLEAIEKLKHTEQE